MSLDPNSMQTMMSASENGHYIGWSADCEYGHRHGATREVNLDGTAASLAPLQHLFISIVDADQRCHYELTT